MAIALRSPYSTYPGAAQTGVVVVTGDLIVFMISHVSAGSLQSFTVTDNAGGGSNSYTKVCEIDAPATIVTSGYMYYAIAKASETLTITANFSPTDPGVSVHVYSGTASTSVVNAQNVIYNSASSTSQTGASITTTAANVVMVSFWAQEANGGNSSTGDSFVERTDQGTHMHHSFDRIVSATGTYSNTINTPNSPYINLIAAFKAPASAVPLIGPGAIMGGNLINNGRLVRN